MGRKFEDATSERLVEVMLTGGPRISGDAFGELLERLHGGQDVVSLLPALEGLEGVTRRRVLKLLRWALIRQQDGPGLLASLSGRTENEMVSSLLDWGNYIDDPALVAVLVDKVIALLRSDSADVANHAAYALSKWCRRDYYQPWDSGVDFSAMLADGRKSKSMPGVGSTLLPGFIHAAERSERAAGIVTEWLAHEQKDVRRVAATLETWILLRKESSSIENVQRHLARFLGQRDAAVRAGVVQCLESGTQDPKRAEAILRAAFGVPDQKVRTLVANAVAKALAPRFKPSPEVKLAIKGMSSPDLAVRRESAGACAGYLIDVIDCRSAAPHLAMALADPDQQVRENAALSLYYAFDMQGNVDVVRATVACIRAARTTASGEAAQHLDSALRDAENAR